MPPLTQKTFKKRVDEEWWWGMDRYDGPPQPDILGGSAFEKIREKKGNFQKNFWLILWEKKHCWMLTYRAVKIEIRMTFVWSSNPRLCLSTTILYFDRQRATTSFVTFLSVSISRLCRFWQPFPCFNTSLHKLFQKAAFSKERFPAKLSFFSTKNVSVSAERYRKGARRKSRFRLEAERID